MGEPGEPRRVQILGEFVSRHDAGPSPDEKRRNLLEGIGAVLLITVVVGGLYALLGWATHSTSEWVDRAPQVQRLLNDRYVEDIQHYRGQGRGRIQVLVIDGRLRTDCLVRGEDTAPEIACWGDVDEPTLDRAAGASR